MAFAASQYLSTDEFIDVRRVQDAQLNVQFSHVRASIDETKVDIRILKEDVREVNQDVQILKGDVFVLREDVRTLKEDVVVLKEDVRILKEDVAVLKEDVRTLKEDVRGIGENLRTLGNRMDGFDARLEETQVEVQRSAALSRNALLRNPTLPLHIMVIYHPMKGLVRPDYNCFPRHAEEFYSLRYPKTDRQHRMLRYLASFYDVLSGIADPSSDEDSSDDGFPDPEVVVDRLEGILGLNEENFMRFRERAQEMARRPPAPPIKRQFQPTLFQFQPESAERKAERRAEMLRMEEQVMAELKLEAQRDINHPDWVPPEKRKGPKSDPSSHNTRVGWDTRSRHSSQVMTLGKAVAMQREREQNLQREAEATDRERAQNLQRESSNSGSPTNPNTSPRAT